MSFKIGIDDNMRSNNFDRLDNDYKPDIIKFPEIETKKPIIENIDKISKNNIKDLHDDSIIPNIHTYNIDKYDPDITISLDYEEMKLSGEIINPPVEISDEGLDSSRYLENNSKFGSNFKIGENK